MLIFSTNMLQVITNTWTRNFSFFNLHKTLHCARTSLLFKWWVHTVRNEEIRLSGCSLCGDTTGALHPFSLHPLRWPHNPQESYKTHLFSPLNEATKATKALNNFIPICNSCCGYLAYLALFSSSRPYFVGNSVCPRYITTETPGFLHTKTLNGPIFIKKHLKLAFNVFILWHNAFFVTLILF